MKLLLWLTSLVVLATFAAATPDELLLHASKVVELAPADIAPHYDAVTGFVLTCDAAAFAAGRHQAPIRRAAQTNVNAQGHRQPFASTLYTTFSAHGRRFSFTLHLNRNGFAAGMQHDLFAEDGEMPIQSLVASARTYVGINDAATAVDGVAERMHAVLHDDGSIHATLAVGETLITVDAVHRHKDVLGEHYDTVATAAAAAAAGGVHEKDETLHLTAFKEPTHTLSSLLFHQNGGVAVGGGFGGSIGGILNENHNAAPSPSSPLRRLLKTGNGSKRDPARWTSCYPGEETGRAIAVGFAIDTAFYHTKCKGSAEGCDAVLSEILSDINLIYVPQMNIHIRATKIHIQTENSTDALITPWNRPWKKKRRGGKCKGGEKDAYKQIYSFMDWKVKRHASDVGLFHLLTSCTYTDGLRGVGVMSQLCSKKHGVGCQMQTKSSPWWVLAHEIGHNFGANHSFERGQGRTGGLMDYGDGRLKGTYQFNSKYRKHEVCKEITKKSVGRSGPFSNPQYSAVCWQHVVAPDAEENGADGTYTVQEGDTCHSVAAKFFTSCLTLQKLNKNAMTNFADYFGKDIVVPMHVKAVIN